MMDKEKLKQKISAMKAKLKNIKAKVKGNKKMKIAVITFACLAMCGCMETQPASRATTANYRFEFSFDDSARNNTVNLTLGDGASASADSNGSTETQTATPTMDIKPDIDVHYNDAVKNATDASKGVLETLLSTSASNVLQMMESKETGSVEVQKKDGTTATVACKDGQCSFQQ